MKKTSIVFLLLLASCGKATVDKEQWELESKCLNCGIIINKDDNNRIEPSRIFLNTDELFFYYLNEPMGVSFSKEIVISNLSYNDVTIVDAVISFDYSLDGDGYFYADDISNQVIEVGDSFSFDVSYITDSYMRMANIAIYIETEDEVKCFIVRMYGKVFLM